MSSSQIAGFTVTNLWEIETATKAGRVTLRAEDYGALGIYSEGGQSGTMAAALGAAAPIFSFRWTHASNLALVKRVILSVAAGATVFTAGAAKFDLFGARSFSVSDSGGSSILPSGNQNKLRTTGMGSTLAGDIRIATTATLTPGTRTVDANPIASVVAGVQATAGFPILAPYPIFEARPGEHPMLLAQNEGLVLQATVPATGTWQFGIKIDWTEIAAY